MEKPVFISVGLHGKDLIRIDQILRIERLFGWPKEGEPYLKGLTLHMSDGPNVYLHYESDSEDIKKITDRIQIV